jgi:predicted nucleic acid-binding protein
MELSLLDTDIVSELLRAVNPRVVGKGRDYLRQFGTYTTSAVSVVELVRGFQKAGRANLIDDLKVLLGQHEVLPLDQESAIVAGMMAGRLQSMGQTIGQADPMIAGIALHHDLMLATGNTAHYERIVHLGFPLRLDNWRL